MTITELAEVDRLSRRQILAAALRDEERGRQLAAARAGRVDAFDRNIRRLRQMADAEEAKGNDLRVSRLRKMIREVAGR